MTARDLVRELRDSKLITHAQIAILAKFYSMM